MTPPATHRLWWCFECGRQVRGESKHQRSTGPGADYATCPGTAVLVEYTDPVPVTALGETQERPDGS